MKKEEIEEKRKKEMIRQLRKEPDLESFQEDRKKITTYAQGAILYSMGIHSFMDLAKAAKATYYVKGIVLVNTEKVDEYMELMCADDPSEI
jgi:hypothetical protein